MATEVAPAGASAAGVRGPVRPAAPVSVPGDDADVHQYRWLILLGLITAAIMEVLDTTIVNVALPQMAGNLGATQRGDRLGEHRLHPLERRRPADDRVLHGARSAGSNYLTFSIIALRRRVVPVRHVAQPDRARDLAHRPGRRRRGAALHGAGDAAADLPARAAGHGAGDLPPRHHRRADARAHARRLDHRQLHLELVLLHQHPDRHRCRPSSSRRSCTIRQDASASRSGSTGSASRCSPSASARCSTCSRKATRTTGSTTRSILRLAIAVRRLSDGDGLVGAVAAEQASGHRTSACSRTGSSSASIFLFVALGFGLYGGVFIFPLFTQTHPRLHADRDRARAAARRPRDRASPR